MKGNKLKGSDVALTHMRTSGATACGEAMGKKEKPVIKGVNASGAANKLGSFAAMKEVLGATVQKFTVKAKKEKTLGIIKNLDTKLGFSTPTPKDPNRK